jgi:hypothetical protein
MPRELPPFLYLPVHGSNEPIPCVVCTSTAIHTVGLPEGHFAIMVQHRAGRPFGYASIIDADEAETMILFLRNAIEDAKLLDAGKEPIHCASSLTRN